MKRKLSMILALLMLATSFCACASDGGSEGENAAADAAVDTTASVDEVPADPLPEDLKFDGETVRFLARDRDWMADELAVDDLNGEAVNDAVYKRHQLVEERLGVKLSTFKTGGTDQYAIKNLVKELVQAGSDEYDIFHNSNYSTIMNTGDNIFHNLYDFKYLNLENPWWSQGFNAEASIGKAQYLATGDIALSLRRLTFVTFFNKKLFEDYKVENIYDVVRDGKWTLEYQGRIAEQMYRDLNGDQQKDQDDAFGFMTNGTQIGVDPYWSACNLDILKKTADNTYEYVIDIDRLSRAVTSINKLIWENEGSWSIPGVAYDWEQETIAQLFSNGNVGMVTLRLIEAEGAHLRGMEDDYGILPIPKLDETDEYYSYAHDQFNSYGMPTTLKEERFDLVGATLEYMAYQSKLLVMPAYYDNALKFKYASDPDSGEMLDLIFDNFKVDAGVFYTKNLNSVHQGLRGLIANNSNDVASTYQEYATLVPTLLDEMQQMILALETEG